MLVLAGPGSGKTFVLTERIRFLIQEHKVSPDKILVITFSKKAAKEMQQRFLKLMCDSTTVTFGTFHAVFFHILRQYRHYSQECILTAELKKKYMAEAAKQFPASESEAFAAYKKRCVVEGKLDFDDMITDCLELFQEREDILKEWQDRYPYILVDEFQDSQDEQYELIRLLAGRACNLFAVGDDDQSIYGFRGASPKIIKRMLEELPDCKRVVLVKNYRCAGKIIQAADSLIRNSSERVEKEMQRPGNSSRSEGVVEVKKFSTAEEEAEYVVHTLKEIDRDTQKERSAVLYRTAGVIRLLEERLLIEKIPYEKKEPEKSFYEEEWVMDILAYLRLAENYEQDFLTEELRYSLLRILNRPQRGLTRECTGEQSFSDALQYFEGDCCSYKNMKKLICDLKLLSGMHPYAAVIYIIKGCGYRAYMREYLEARGFSYEETEDMRKELLERSKKFSSLKDWFVHIDRLKLLKQQKGNCKKEGRANIVLQTIHASKGLEYDNVFVIGLREGILPHKKAVSEEAIEEERRVLYVAMTRARTRLYLCTGNDERQDMQISRFIKELCQT